MSYTKEDFEQFSNLLKEMAVSIVGFNDNKERCVKLPTGSISAQQFGSRILKSKKFIPKIVYDTIQAGDLQKFVREFCAQEDLVIEASAGATEHRTMLKEYTLAKDLNFTFDKEAQYFLVTPEDQISLVPAHHYISMMNIETPDEIAMPLIREYLPREPKGILKRKLLTGEMIDHINSYIPPDWMSYQGEVPDCLPKEIELLFNQITDEIDRKFFYHWLYQSITSRAMVYLVLCGHPAVGKNRIKAVIKALHGHHNTVDGKKNTLTGSFNSQLANNTYVHFDELKFTMEEENIMKEIPNGTIAIEEKFKDTTRATRLFCSMVISNNKPRDNYIAFDARKFAPLKLSSERLESVMDSDTINEFSKKIDFPDKETYDVKYIAQIGRWILKHGNHQKLFPQGEHRGQRFWELAHSSMFAWQKVVIKVLSDLKSYSREPERHLEELKNGRLLFSEVQTICGKEKKLKIRESDFPNDLSSAFYFLKIFRDVYGDPVYEVQPADDAVYGDFYIKKLVGKYRAEDLL